MQAFMDKDFLLSTPTARTLYHDVAAKCPIIDYHCHISPREIYETCATKPSPRYGWAAITTSGA